MVPRETLGAICDGDGTRRFEDEAGAILVLWTVALTAILAFVALAIDFGNDVQRSTNVQNAADAAALAGASQLPGSETQAASLAQDVVAKYGITGDWASCTPPTGFVAASGTLTCIGFDQSGNTIWVEIPTQSVVSLFGSTGGAKVDREAYATASSGQGALCYTATATATTLPGECS